MRKKSAAALFAAALIACAITTCTITACGTYGVGEEVTREEWEEAFSNTKNLENYTYKYRMVTAETYKNDDKNYTATQNRVLEVAHYVNTDKIYSVANYNWTISGLPEDDEDSTGNLSYQSYLSEYYEADGNSVLCASYFDYSYTLDNDNDEIEDEVTEDPAWKVETASSMPNPLFDSNYLPNLPNPLKATNYGTTDSGSTASLAELYEEFEYSNGIYSAQLYEGSVLKYVYVSILNGYVVKLMTVAEMSESSSKSVIKYIYEYSNFDSTKVAPDAAAVKAIENYKNQ